MDRGCQSYMDRGVGCYGSWFSCFMDHCCHIIPIVVVMSYGSCFSCFIDRGCRVLWVAIVMLQNIELFA
jgi:hypothetical protein